MPPFYEWITEGYLRLAVVRLVVDFLRPAVVRGLRAADDRFAVLLRAVDRFAVLFLPPVFFRAAEERLAVDFLAVDFLLRVAAAFLPALDRAAVFFLRVAAPFRAAADLFVEEVFRPVDFLRVAAICHLLSPLRTPCASGVVARVR
jgi:hypothetical protein